MKTAVHNAFISELTWYYTARGAVLFAYQCNMGIATMKFKIKRFLPKKTKMKNCENQKQETSKRRHFVIENDSERRTTKNVTSVKHKRYRFSVFVIIYKYLRNHIVFKMHARKHIYFLMFHQKKIIM
jgi:hypothetical protein